MRRCPSCGATLNRLTVAEVELDGCQSCGGIWLDRDELQRLGNVPGALAAASREFVRGQLPVVGT
ncbi:MAG: zf-TFIIB domain-containing protein, partial [Myxococcales bacterium]